MRSLIVLCLTVVGTHAAVSAQTLEDRLTSIEERLVELERRSFIGDAIARVYARYNSAVVRVNAGLANGTGFFLTHGGHRLIVTNDHVLAGGIPITVTVNSAVRVPVQVVGRSVDDDLAILATHGSVCPNCATFNLPDDVTITPGEPVLALGYPFGLALTVSAGVVGSVHGSILVSDVSTNPGNSGGPLISPDGSLLGINTFVRQDAFGPGLSGALTVAALRRILNAAPPPAVADLPVDTLPLISGPPYPTSLLLELGPVFAHGATHKPLLDIDAPRFTVTLMTPVYQAALVSGLRRSLSDERRAREQRVGIDEQERYREAPPYRAWIENVGPLTTPAVSVMITPKRRVSTAGFFERLFSSSESLLEFDGDLQSVTFFREGTEVKASGGGTTPIESVVGGVAFRGLFVLDPLIFRPTAAAYPPRITLRFHDLKHPDDSLGNMVVLPTAAVARAWNDFVPYLQTVDPDPQWEYVVPSQTLGEFRDYVAMTLLDTTRSRRDVTRDDLQVVAQLVGQIVEDLTHGRFEAATNTFNVLNSRVESIYYGGTTDPTVRWLRSYVDQLRSEFAFPSER